MQGMTLRMHRNHEAYDSLWRKRGKPECEYIYIHSCQKVCTIYQGLRNPLKIGEDMKEVYQYDLICVCDPVEKENHNVVFIPQEIIQSMLSAGACRLQEIGPPRKYTF